jgi:hypothetical protein
MTRSADLQPGEAELETGLVTLRGSQLATRTSASAASRARMRVRAGPVLGTVCDRQQALSRSAVARPCR